MSMRKLYLKPDGTTDSNLPAAMPDLYIQANDPAEYKKLEKAFKGIMGPPIFTTDVSEKIEFDPITMQIKIYLTLAELLEKIAFDYKNVFANYQINFGESVGLFKIQLTERATPAIRLEFKEAEKKKESMKFLAELEMKTSTPVERKSEVIDERELFDSQISMVKDNHSVAASKQWIIDHVEKFGPKKILIVEFSKHEEDKVKLKEEIGINNANANTGPNDTTSKIFEMIDTMLASGGDVIGGENALSMEANSKLQSVTAGRYAITTRCRTMDASFCEKIKNILTVDPDMKIILWAGAGHAEGLIKNILTLYPAISIATIYPGTAEPVYRYNAPTKTAAAAPSPAPRF